MSAPWLDTRRLPNLSAEATARLRALVEDPAAPRFTARSGHHLLPQDLQHLTGDKTRYLGPPQAWLEPFLARCRKQVPYYRAYDWSRPFSELPCTNRGDLSKDVAAFIPDDLPLERMIAFETSGTTGHPLRIPSHPLVAGRYHYFHERALQWHGLSLQDLDGDTGVFLVGFQQRCFTYVSVLPYWGNKALAKLNLNRADWPDAQAPGRYIDRLRPLLITGDPRSLSELASINFVHQPCAVLSTSMALLAAQKQLFEQHFGCPVINIYSMNEAGPIAADDTTGRGLRLLQNELLVEIVDAKGTVLPQGQRGEVCLTGGFNDYLPLLRYRTGDYAKLWQDEHGRQYLQDLDGRPPVRFRTATGWINNVDVTHLLQPFALAQYQLHQRADGRLRLRIGQSHNTAVIRSAFARVFGAVFPLDIQAGTQFEDKVIQYTSDYPGALN